MDFVTSMETNEIRIRSLDLTSKAGLSVPTTLPLLDPASCVRGKDEVVNRLFCLTAVAATSYGLDGSKALAWLGQERLDESLTAAERSFLQRGDGDRRGFQLQVEAMWALAWALSLVPHFDYWKDADNGFVAILPDLRTQQSGASLRNRSRIRPKDELAIECDLAYCLHWAVRDAELRGLDAPAGLKPYVVIERRRALEWLLGNEPWNAVSLDT